MKNLSIKVRLFGLVAFLLICIGIMGGSAISSMNKINSASTEISKNWMPSIIVAEELNTLTSDYRNLEYKHILSHSNSEMAQVKQNLDKKAAEINDMFNSYTPLITNDTDKQLMEEAKTAWATYIQKSNEMISLSEKNETERANAIMEGESQDLFDKASGNFLKVVEFNKDGGDNASLEGDKQFETISTITFFSLIIIVIIAVVISIFIVRGISKPVSEMDHVAKMIADGDLNTSIHYQSTNELGRLAGNFNKTVTRLKEYVDYINEISYVLDEIADGNLMFELTYDYKGEFAKIKKAFENISKSLNATMSQINEASEQVASGSDQVSSGAQALSQGATEQASSVEELAATINEISGQVKRNADNAVQANSIAIMAGNEIMQSNDQMKKMIEAMHEINNSSNEIGKIIKTIEDIAFQTNILALNAAVEAARAGAAGKGFAVVADEVRNLASKSSSASKDTAVLIEGSIKAVENGVKIAEDTAKMLANSVEGAKNVAEVVDTISNESKKQADSIAQVTLGIDQISAVVQTNSATAEESAAASEELSGQAQLLKSLVSKFKLKDNKNQFAEESYQTASVNANYEQEPVFTSSIGSSKY